MLGKTTMKLLRLKFLYPLLLLALLIAMDSPRPYRMVKYGNALEFMPSSEDIRDWIKVNVKEKQSDCASYDFVVDIGENLMEIADQGWPVMIKTDQVAEKMVNVPATDSKTVGVLGYYSKGKSFLINLIYNMVSSPPPLSLSTLCTSSVTHNMLCTCAFSQSHTYTMCT